MEISKLSSLRIDNGQRAIDNGAQMKHDYKFKDIRMAKAIAFFFSLNAAKAGLHQCFNPLLKSNGK